MLYLQLAVGAAFSVLVVEAVLRTKIIARVMRIPALAQRAGRAMGYKRVNDRWKEKAIRGYSSAMLIASFWMLGFVILIGALVLVIDVLLEGFSGFVMSWLGIIWTILIAWLYLGARKRLNG